MHPVTRALSILFLGLAALAACTPEYDPPEDVISIQSRSSAPVLRHEAVIIRTGFVSGGAYTQLPHAQCSLTYHGATTRFTAPRRVQIPVHAGQQESIKLDCQTVIGATSVRSARVLDPKTPVVAQDAKETRIYPKDFGVLF